MQDDTHQGLKTFFKENPNLVVFIGSGFFCVKPNLVSFGVFMGFKLLEWTLLDTVHIE